MRLGWVTDVHLDFYRDLDARRAVEGWRGLGYDGLIVTGDISTSAKLRFHLGLLRDSFGASAYYVLGNHDYWGSSFSVLEKEVAEWGLGSYLPAVGPIDIAPGTVLAGFDGFYDGVNGDRAQSDFLMRDWMAIGELAADAPWGTPPVRAAMARARQSVGRFDSALRARLGSTGGDVRQVIVATHVPPYPEASYHRGQPATPASLPWYSSALAGARLDGLSRDYPSVTFRVLAGHTHAAVLYDRAPNLSVRVAGAEYGLTPAPCDIFV